MAEGDASSSGNLGFNAASSMIARPTHQEVLRLHRELQIWMMHTRYTMQGVDNQPLWRTHNTSLVLGTGAGLGAYFGFAKFLPSMKPIVRAVPATVFFYFTYRACQVQQLPHLYGSLLSLPTPLGGKGREVLTALRSGGQLPSQEFANQTPPPANQPSAAGIPASPSGAPSRADASADTSQVPSPAVDLGQGYQMPQDSLQRDLGQGYQMPQASLPRVTPPEPEAVPPSDPWGAGAGFGAEAPGGEAPGWGGGDAWPAEQAAGSAKPRSTWEQIRARQAAAAAAAERR